MIWLPSVEEVQLLHKKLVEASGGSAGVRDLSLIESAINRATAAFGGIEAHRGIVAKAAAIGCGLTQNHGFVDGNKRIGMATMILILRRNGIWLSCSQDDVIALGLAVAQGVADVDTVQKWIEAHRAED